MKAVPVWCWVFVGAVAGECAAQPTVRWASEPGGVAVATDAAENIYSVRWDYAPGGDIYLARRDKSGVLQWEARHDQTDTTRHEVATAVATDSAGDIVVSGTVRSGYSSPVNANSLLMKFSASGQLVWRLVDGQDFDGASTRRVLINTKNQIHVLGLGPGPQGMTSRLRRFSPAGELLWSWSDSVGIGAPLTLKAAPGGDWLVSARASTGLNNGYARINRKGQTVFSVTGIASVSAGDIAGDAQGNTFVVNGLPAGGTSSLLRKLDAKGQLLWEQPVPLNGTRVEVDSHGTVVVAGYPSSGQFGAAFARFSPDGQLLWQQLDADGPGVALLAHAHMVLDSQGTACVAGSTMSEMGLSCVSADGQNTWTALAPGGYPQWLAAGRKGRFYLVGGNTARVDLPR